ncbi:hypothetical protein A4G99_03820 [Haladaptatus sp. R4]|uniref:DUF7845 domain-containing protein n=1 Tax=Haladaptatus sp. R4 TaxID=1679489 RepID=UPI0007B4F2D1|nr:hypothetical protein [Haladaptatus sp. R4]KZN25608.1 hypothetical protein A4G99_03820 [Haladaptatus sp. R4]
MKRPYHVASAPHELGAKLYWPSIAPYFTLGKFIRSLDGGTRADEPIRAEIPTGPDGRPEDAKISLTYHTGKIAPRLKDSRDPDKGMWELDLHWTGDGQRKVSMQIKPRWKNMRHVESGNQISTPFDSQSDYTEGVEVLLQGSNLEPDEYITVIQETCRAIAHECGERWSSRHFRPGDVVPWISGIFQHERYLRIHRQFTDSMCKGDGIFSKLQQLYATEKGSHIRFDLDNTETIGYQNKVELPDHSVEPLPGLEHGVKLEWYHPKNVRSEELLAEGDALAHPKYEVLFRLGKNKNDNLKLNSRSVPWSERNKLVSELEGFLVNSLNWAGIPIEPDAPNVFVPDLHFTPESSDRATELTEDPTPHMETSRRSALVRTLADANDRELDALHRIMADGGTTHYEALADELGSVSTVYRALSGLNELVENNNGTLEFVCQKVHEDLREIFAVAEGQVEYARKATERMLRLADGNLKNVGSTLRKWMQKYGVEIVESDAVHADRVIKIEALLGRTDYDARALGVPSLPDVIDQGFMAWTGNDFQPSEFRQALIECPDGKGGVATYRVSNVLP